MIHPTYIIRSGCLVNFVSEVKEKRTVMKVFIKFESFWWGWGGYKKLSVCVPGCLCAL